MKKILLLFCLLPMLSFGQGDTIRVDSVSFVNYLGGINRKKPKPIMNRYRYGDDRYSKTEMLEDREKRFQKVVQKYPNYDKSRDMPLPVSTNTILNKNGKFHPSVKWESYQTFPVDSMTEILKILNCQLSEFIEYIDSDGTLIKLYRSPNRSAMCYFPRLGILIWSNNEIITFYSVCFECGHTAEGTNNSYMRNYKSCIYMNELKEEIERLGYSLE